MSRISVRRAMVRLALVLATGFGCQEMDGRGGGGPGAGKADDGDEVPEVDECAVPGGPVAPPATRITPACVRRVDDALLARFAAARAGAFAVTDEALLANERLAMTMSAEYDCSGDPSATFAMSTTSLEGGGSVVDVTTAADGFSEHYVFDRDGALLLADYTMDDSAEASWYCADAGEPRLAEPDEYCLDAFVHYVTRRVAAIDEGEGTLFVAEDEQPLPALVQTALREYRSELSLDAVAPIDYRFERWAGTYDGVDVARVSFSGRGRPTVTYVLGGDQYSGWLFLRRQDDGVAFVCRRL